MIKGRAVATFIISSILLLITFSALGAGVTSFDILIVLAIAAFITVGDSVLTKRNKPQQKPIERMDQLQ